jgi:3-hydroxyisobutyrate dehydrogenase-like beta-hydroxyacid dehydrogenase
MSCKVSFIGLGVMGYPMAGYISKAGHNVTVYNRTKAKAEKWAISLENYIKRQNQKVLIS